MHLLTDRVEQVYDVMYVILDYDVTIYVFISNGEWFFRTSAETSLPEGFL